MNNSIETPELNKADAIQIEIANITDNLDAYIEQNSTRVIEFMKYESFERMNFYLEEYDKALKAVQKLNQGLQNDPAVKTLEKEIEWYQTRIDYLSDLQDRDNNQISQYKQIFHTTKQQISQLEKQLKENKHEVIKTQKFIDQTFTSSRIRSPTIIDCLQKTRYRLSDSQKEQYEYLKSASKRIKQTLQDVKDEVQRYKSEEFKTRQKILPLDEFFTECCKSVYRFIFQRQSQLDENQLSLAYKMFRDNKMEYSDIVHRSHNTNRDEKYVIRDALKSNFQSKSSLNKLTFTTLKPPTWQEFRKLPVETIFILISRKEILKVLRQGLCSVVFKTFVTTESKINLDPIEEFCKAYVVRLRIRKNEKGLNL